MERNQLEQRKFEFFSRILKSLDFLPKLSISIFDSSSFPTRVSISEINQSEVIFNEPQSESSLNERIRDHIERDQLKLEKLRFSSDSLSLWVFPKTHHTYFQPFPSPHRSEPIGQHIEGTTFSNGTIWVFRGS